MKAAKVAADFAVWQAFPKFCRMKIHGITSLEICRPIQTGAVQQAPEGNYSRKYVKGEG
jgi:hypothetical protein